MTELRKIKRALVSVSDKTGIIDFAKELTNFGVQIISTGGTAKSLRENGIDVTEVSEITNFPEMMDGRVKTLHPKIHGAFLALRDNESHVSSMNEHGIEPIDLVVVNLYPFSETIRKKDVSLEEAVENIDIGGPAMIRSAAKNWRDVAVVVAPELYGMILNQMKQNEGATTLDLRQMLAVLAFWRTTTYDEEIVAYLRNQVDVENLPPEISMAVVSSGLNFAPDFRHDDDFEFDDEADDDFDEDEFDEIRESLQKLIGGNGSPLALPDFEEDDDEMFYEEEDIPLNKAKDLRYGENPHQKAALYHIADEQGGVAQSEILQGKEMSFNNYLDADAAWRLISDFDETACAIIKHTNPSGVGIGANLTEAYNRALSTDPISAFGGIVAFNRKVDAKTAEAMSEVFTEVVLAPDFEPDALKVFGKKKNLRVMKVDDVVRDVEDFPPFDYRLISGGMLLQVIDEKQVTRDELKIVTERKPSDDEIRAMLLAWKVCKHVKSNAIVFANENQTIGVGAGQMNRVDSVRIAAMRAERFSLPLKNSAVASDAFFPFRDNVDEAASFGVSAIIQPGGSIKDDESIAAANEHGIAMVFTGFRHFKH
jgi:phosphoribosylaminoimidazolecarboxamide formyltransferase/IMP cyclohydrolase